MTSSGGLFPTEIICQIISFADPLDVVLRLRAVSKQFREIIYDPTIWKTLYVNARLPRPPGPFPHQSASFLERTLIRSARLAEFWMTQRIQDTAIVTVPRASTSALPRESYKMIAGRWLLGCEFYRQFVLHDIESPMSPPKALQWEFEGSVYRWDATYITSPKGDMVYVLFGEKDMRHSRAPFKLLEFRLNTDSGELYDCMSLDVPTWNFCEPSLSMLSCYRGPFIYIPSQSLVFDTRTRNFFEFPPFSTGLDLPPASLTHMMPSSVLTTSTHIFTLFVPFCGDVGRPALVQAFAPPTHPGPAADNTCILHLTHEATMPRDVYVERLTPIRDSVIDPISGSTRLRLMHTWHNNDGTDLQCVNFTLPKSDPDFCVLPISIHTHHLFSVENDVRDTRPSYIQFIESSGQESDDGYIRGLCLRSPEWIHHYEDMKTHEVMKFTIDASGDECTGTFGEVERPTWNHIDGISPGSLLNFDGVRGRICWSNRVDTDRWDPPSHVDILVLDIK